MKLIILGNGFDLHHQYKTSFHDFRTHLQNSTNNDDKHLITQIDELVGVNSENPKTNLLWNDYESIIGGIMSTEKYKKHSVKNIPNLMEEFAQRFYHYLLNINKLENHKINKKIIEEFKDAAIILTFNYTSIYSSYINNGDSEIFHIHGELSEKNLPIIGYHYQNALKNKQSSDYLIRYGNKEVHKGALAFKQNEIDLERLINRFTEKWKNKISEIAIIGYSFGQSDNHIYNILNTLLIQKTSSLNVPSTQAEKIKSINFKIYDYNKEESNKIIDKIKVGLSNFHRMFSIKITGVGFTKKEKEIIKFELKNY